LAFAIFLKSAQHLWKVALYSWGVAAELFYYKTNKLYIYWADNFYKLNRTFLQFTAETFVNLVNNL